MIEQRDRVARQRIEMQVALRLRRFAKADLVRHLSGERIAAEMRLLLAATDRTAGLRLLADSGLLEQAAPELADPARVAVAAWGGERAGASEQRGGERETKRGHATPCGGVKITKIAHIAHCKFWPKEGPGAPA